MVNRPWSYEAEIIGVDKITDIATKIKAIDKENFKEFEWNMSKTQKKAKRLCPWDMGYPYLTQQLLLVQ